jgi:hypothetical protein
MPTGGFFDEMRGRHWLREQPLSVLDGAIQGVPVNAVLDPYGNLVSEAGPISFKGTVLIDAYNTYVALEDAFDRKDVNFTNHWQEIPL